MARGVAIRAVALPRALGARDSRRLVRDTAAFATRYADVLRRWIRHVPGCLRRAQLPAGFLTAIGLLTIWTAGFSLYWWWYAGRPAGCPREPGGLMDDVPAAGH